VAMGEHADTRLGRELKTLTQMIDPPAPHTASAPAPVVAPGGGGYLGYRVGGMWNGPVGPGHQTNYRPSYPNQPAGARVTPAPVLTTAATPQVATPTPATNN